MFKKYLQNLSTPESYISISLGFLVVLIAGLLMYNYFTNKREAANPSASPQEKAQEIALLPKIHKVEENETLWDIANKYYGSGYNWVSITSENKLTNPNYLEVGQELTIPKAETIKLADDNMLSTSIEPKRYTVVAGDTLWDIGVREYNDGYAWSRIASANQLVNPDLIHAGNLLLLPIK